MRTRKDLTAILNAGKYLKVGKNYQPTNYDIVSYGRKYVRISTYCRNEYGSDWGNEDLIQVERAVWDSLPNERDPYEMTGEKPVRKDLKEILKVGTYEKHGHGYYQTGYDIVSYNEESVFISTYCTNEYGSDWDNEDRIEVSRAVWDTLPDEKEDAR